jgi:hypothetical protein
MKAVWNFLVKPIDNRYDNSIKINDKNLILNTSIEKFKFISNRAIIVKTPKAFNTVLKEGDEIVIHHNVFRRYYNQKGKAVDSSKKFIDDLFFCQPDQIYLYKTNNKWKSFGDRCFVAPIKNKDPLTLDKEQKNIGILKYGNKLLEARGISERDLIGFPSMREFEFIIDNTRLYCLHIDDILIKYEYKGNEEEYNPSWAKSS